MKLIVGLGNPGPKYSKNIHNAGFIVIDELAKRFNFSVDQSKFNGLYTKQNISGNSVIFAKPLTFMNLSGSFIFQISNYYGIAPEDILVIYDEKDIDINTFKYKFSGGSAGHNGIKDTINSLKTNDFARLRIGVKPNREMTSIKDYVLSNFASQDLTSLKNNDRLYDSIMDFIDSDFLEVANKYNAK